MVKIVKETAYLLRDCCYYAGYTIQLMALIIAEKILHKFDKFEGSFEK